MLGNPTCCSTDITNHHAPEQRPSSHHTPSGGSMYTNPCLLPSCSIEIASAIQWERHCLENHPTLSWISETDQKLVTNWDILGPIHIQCLQKVFRPLDFSHLLHYSLILKWIKFLCNLHRIPHNDKVKTGFNISIQTLCYETWNWCILFPLIILRMFLQLDWSLW